MRRRLLTALLAGVLMPAGLAGCGIPDQTEVQVDGPGPAAESGVLNGSAAQPPTATASSDPKEFILNYLSAAAGEPDQAYERVRQFVAPNGRSRLRDKQNRDDVELTVVRLRENPEATPPNNEGTSKVTIKVQQVGVLRADGTLAPPVATDTVYTFQLRRSDSGGWWIATPPSVLLLSTDALRTYFARRTIYFWNSDQQRLVPDQRYLPAGVSAERRITQVARWLAGDPSDWLARTVTRLPQGTGPINNATGSDGRWELNLNMPGVNDERLARLATQLAWSLEDLTGQLELKVQNQSRRTVDLEQERQANPLFPSESPQRFCVYDGAIRPLSIGNEPVGPVPVVAEANKGVVSAALSRSDDETFAALVVSGPDRRQQLRVGFGRAPVMLFNRSGWYGSIARPVWLRSADPHSPSGLVVADGELYRFDGRASMSKVSLTVTGPVNAVAGSLDGQRIALIIGGVLYVAAVTVDGGVTVGQPRQLVTRLAELTAVDWYAENELLVAGSDGRPAIYQTSIDGALETPLETDIGAEVTHLAAYPGGAVGALPSFSYMYEANKVAYKNNPPGDIIKREQVKDVAQAPGTKASNPTAPFFLY